MTFYFRWVCFRSQKWCCLVTWLRPSFKARRFFRYLDLNFSYFLLLHDLWWHGWALASLDWHLSLQMTWNCRYQYNWHTMDLYLCRRGLKFIVSCNEERRLSLMLIFVKFWWLRAKLQGGWSNPQGNSSKSDSLCIRELLGGSFNLTKFHPNRRGSLCHACLVPSWTQS